MTKRNDARRDAKAKGRPVYIGKPCRVCGMRIRYVSTSNCRACLRQRSLDYEMAKALTYKGDAMARASVVDQRERARSRQAASRAARKAAAQAQHLQLVTTLELALWPILRRIKAHDR